MMVVSLGISAFHLILAAYFAKDWVSVLCQKRTVASIAVQ